MDEYMFYRDIAQLLGVKPDSVRHYRIRYKGTDLPFPEPVTPPEVRSPMFRRADVERWAQARAQRHAEDAKRGKGGVPPRYRAE